MSLRSVHEELFDELDAALQHDIELDDVLIGLNARDLVGLTTLANIARRSDLLHIIQNTAVQQQEAADNDMERKRYNAVGKVITAMLYVNNDPNVIDSPPITSQELALFTEIKKESEV